MKCPKVQDKAGNKSITSFMLILKDSEHILHTFLHTCPKVLAGRICLTIKTALVDDHFLYSHELNL